MNIKSLFNTGLAILALLPLSASAHDGHSHSYGDVKIHSQPYHPKLQQAVVAINTQADNVMVSFQLKDQNLKDEDKPAITAYFEKFRNVKTRWNADTLFVESNGLPDHNMMVGIRLWQQQVPLPQPFTGDNAWQIPLKPKLAANPVSTKKALYRGAIALAVNGVPIFNALNNRGEDAYLAGELDEWGGHCGRGDDYHYHMAPVHLEEIVGKGNPIAFALDGFPIYGLTEADGSPVGKLDEYNGQFDSDGKYHYHATKTYPYINGGMRGEVTIRGDQIEPQPRDSPVRPALQPLRGATITDFQRGKVRSVLTYKVRGETGTVTYSSADQSFWKFNYDEPSRKTRTETYERRPRRDDRGGNKPPRRYDPPPPR